MAKSTPSRKGVPKLVFVVDTPENRASGVKFGGFVPQEGPQKEAMRSAAFEILFGGAKGAGKSKTGQGWLLKGNPEYYLKPRTRADMSYIYHPSYRALVLRRNRKDLNTWVDTAKIMYCPMGAEWRDADSEFVWPSGAKFVVDHLADEDAYFKYEGNEFQRMLIEELTHIPTFGLYSNVIKNCRSAFEELLAQIFGTTNPPGPGSSWVRERFVDPVPAGRLMGEKKYNKFTSRYDVITRIFIPAKVTDNKILLEKDPTYVTRMMATMSLSEQRAYIDGDWNAMSGGYFQEFRPHGPLEGSNEPPEARHVVRTGEVPLMPWWPRFMAMDIGHRHYTSILKACCHPNGQLHVYDEMVEAGVGNEEWGVRMAQWCLKELAELSRAFMTLWLSHDAFGNRGDPKTQAQQIEAGIKKVLGTAAPCLLEGDELGKDFFERLVFQHEARILIRKHPTHRRTDGWQYIRDLMRFRQLVKPSKTLFDQAYAQELLEKEGATKYFAYLHAFEERPPEVLPKLVIHEKCRSLVHAIPTAVYDTDGKDPEGVLKTDTVDDDVLDSLRYLCVGFRHSIEKEPASVYVDRKLQEYMAAHPELSPSGIMQVRNRAYSEWERREDKSEAFMYGVGSPRTEGVVLVQ